MSQRLLTLRVRPPRIAVLISNTSSSDDFVLVVRFLSQIWGGRFNPILPVSADQPDLLTEFRLGSCRPDFVFGFNLDDSIWRPAIHNACQPRRYVHLDGAIATDIRKANRLNLIHSNRAIIANFERRARPSAITRPVKAVSVDPSSEWLPYFAALFGIHPVNLSEKYRDEQIVVEAPSATDLINTHLDFVEEEKESWIDAGSFGLSAHHMLFPPVQPTIVVVKDMIPDLCLFWNLRLAWTAEIPLWVIPIPESDALNEDVLNSLKSWLLAFHKYGMRPNYCVMTSASVGKESIERIAARLQAILAGSGIEHVDYEPPKNRLPLGLAFEQTITWPAELRGQHLTIVPPSPKTFSIRNSESWFVDILKDNKTGRAVRNMLLPESTVIPEILNAPCPPSFEHAVVPRFGDGYDSINFHCSSTNEVIHLQIPTATEVLEEILRKQEYDIVSDEKRSSYLPVIKRFGGLHMAATAMSGQAGQVLEILRSGRLRSPDDQAEVDDTHHQSVLIAQGHALTPNQIKSIGRFGKGKLGDAHFLEQIEQMLQRESARVKRIGMARFRRYAQRQVPDEMTLQALLEHWAERSVLVRKWELGPCPLCGKMSFFSGVNLRKVPRCIHCGQHLRMREKTAIGYSLEPSVRHALSQGLGTVVLAGRFLQNMTSRGFFWLPGVKYKKAETKGDIDFMACCDGYLVFGECKKLTSTPHNSASWNSTVDQFLNLASVAIECGVGLVVLAALVDAFPEDVQRRIDTELTGKIPFLLLNKTDLEKGERPAQPDKAWPPIGLHDLRAEQFPEAAVEKTPGRR